MKATFSTLAALAVSVIAAPAPQVEDTPADPGLKARQNIASDALDSVAGELIDAGNPVLPVG